MNIFKKKGKVARAVLLGTIGIALLECASCHDASSPSPAFLAWMAQLEASKPAPLPAARKSVVRDSMTLGELEADLGEGWIHPLSGIYIKQWFFDDGTELNIEPDAVYDQKRAVLYAIELGKDRPFSRQPDGCAYWFRQAAVRAPASPPTRKE